MKKLLCLIILIINSIICIQQIYSSGRPIKNPNYHLRWSQSQQAKQQHKIIDPQPSLWQKILNWLDPSLEKMKTRYLNFPEHLVQEEVSSIQPEEREELRKKLSERVDTSQIDQLELEKKQLYNQLFDTYESRFEIDKNNDENREKLNIVDKKISTLKKKISAMDQKIQDQGIEKNIYSNLKKRKQIAAGNLQRLGKKIIPIVNPSYSEAARESYSQTLQGSEDIGTYKYPNDLRPGNIVDKVKQNWRQSRLGQWFSRRNRN